MPFGPLGVLCQLPLKDLTCMAHHCITRACAQSISGAPAKYDLTSDDPEAWAEAGGHSYGEAPEFPCLVGARWMEVLQKPGGRQRAGATAGKGRGVT